MSYTGFSRAAVSPGYDFLKATTLPDAARDITISDIPARDLLHIVLALYAGTQTADTFWLLNLNGDEDANYDWYVFRAAIDDAASTYQFVEATTELLPTGNIAYLGSNAGDNTEIVGVLTIVNLASRVKVVRGSLAAHSNSTVSASHSSIGSTGRWRNTTDRISSMRLRVNDADGLWAADSSVMVLGRNLS